MCPQLNILKIDPMAKKELLLADILVVGLELENIDSHFNHKNNEVRIEKEIDVQLLKGVIDSSLQI